MALWATHTMTARLSVMSPYYVRPTNSVVVAGKADQSISTYIPPALELGKQGKTDTTTVLTACS